MKFQEVYAVIRQDIWRDMNRAMIEEVITIKEVVMTQEIAEQEVARLNKLNEGKGAKYWWQYTRFFPEGSAGSADDAGTDASKNTN